MRRLCSQCWEFKPLSRFPAGPLARSSSVCQGCLVRHAERVLAFKQARAHEDARLERQRQKRVAKEVY